jgi:hypothetical protein
MFLQKLPIQDFVVTASSGEASFSAKDIYRSVDNLLRKHIFYSVKIYAPDSNVAQSKAEEAFMGVMASIAYVYTARNMNHTWNTNGNMTRRTPAIFNGVFVTILEENANFYYLNELVLKADVKLMGGDVDRNKKTMELFKRLLKIYKSKSNNIVEDKIRVAGRVLYKALSSRRPEIRHLGLWQCIESCLGWRDRKEAEIIDTLKNYYDMGNPNNITWSVMGDYIKDKRNQYVHEGVAIQHDPFGSYDTTLNIYHEYLMVMLGLLLYLESNKKEFQSVKDYKNYLELYAMSKERLKMASRLKESRQY